MMTLSRRHFLRLSAGAAVFPLAARIARAQPGDSARALSQDSARPLAERLAAYAAGLRYDDLDAATVEQVKLLVVDTLGCGIAAFDEEPVRICRDIALAYASGPSTLIGTARRTSP